MKKRVLSFALAVVMCLALLPSAALAADSDFVIENDVLTRYNGSGGHVVIPDGVTEIGITAFIMRPLTGVTIPNSVITIGEGAFSYCENLTSVTIPDSVTTIGNAAFASCPNLANLTIGSGVTSIGNDAFNGCAITSVVIPSSLRSMPGSAFAHCYSLESVTIEDGVSMIGAYTFLNCTSLKSITIPDSVTTIGREAFPNGCIIYGNLGSYAETYAKEWGYPFPASAPDLTGASTWAQEDITAAVAADLVPKDLQSAYTQATTRAEFAALAVALYEKVKDEEITERKTFDDTTDINVEKAAAIGVVEGVGNNKFNPDAALTREQAAVMLSRLVSLTGRPLLDYMTNFADKSSISTWALLPVGQVQDAGIMSGIGDNTFAPQDPYSREQSIATILRVYDRVK